jgi:hypothetical protein
MLKAEAQANLVVTAMIYIYIQFGMCGQFGI